MPASRTLEVPGTDTLDDLCGHILDAFDFNYMDALERLAQTAFRLSDGFDINGTSKSAAMRMEAVAKAAGKEPESNPNEEAETTIASAFEKRAQEGFSDEEVLKRTCLNGADEFRALLSGTEDADLLLARQRRRLFELYAGTFLHHLRQRYTIEKGD